MIEGQQVQAGEILAGKYRVERQLGVGGMGVVVAATHLQLDQRVALKFLLPEALANQEAVQRFLREARAAVKLKSEHVARVSDVGTLHNGAPYIVMEYLEGYDLGQEVVRRGRLPPDMATEYLLQGCCAIAEAHTLGIVHRDIKPANLFLTRRADGTPLIKVLDFGISKAVAATGEQQLTRTQSVMGSPSYMSPEQMRGTRDVDNRTDIWSLGVVLYELLVGRVPWQAESFSAVCLKVAMEPLPAMELPPGMLPAGLEEAVSRCLEKDVAQRFQSVAELAVTLAPYTTDRGRDAVEQICRMFRLTPEAVAAASAVNTRPHPHVITARPFDRTTMGTGAGQVQRRRGLVIGGSVLLLAAAGIVALMLAGGGKEQVAPSPSAAAGAGVVDAAAGAGATAREPDAAVAAVVLPVDIDAGAVAAAVPDAILTFATPPPSPSPSVLKKDKRRKRPPTGGGDIFDSRK